MLALFHFLITFIIKFSYFNKYDYLKHIHEGKTHLDEPEDSILKCSNILKLKMVIQDSRNFRLPSRKATNQRANLTERVLSR